MTRQEREANPGESFDGGTRSSSNKSRRFDVAVWGVYHSNSSETITFFDVEF